MKIYAPLLKTRTIHKGECALYGDKKADKDTLIGLVRYGYADGMDRSQSEPIFNNRCMDISAYKIKDKDMKFYCVMDNADKVAKENNTISYEILTKSAIRAEKIYIN